MKILQNPVETGESSPSSSKDFLKIDNTSCF